jgi:hypothetical protein
MTFGGEFSAARHGEPEKKVHRMRKIFFNPIFSGRKQR